MSDFVLFCPSFPFSRDVTQGIDQYIVLEDFWKKIINSTPE